MTVLELKNVSYRYKDASPDEYVLKDIDYRFDTGKLYIIKGRSGSGKTTFLSLISGLETGYEGSILYENNELNKINLDICFRKINHCIWCLHPLKCCPCKNKSNCT